MNEVIKILTFTSWFEAFRYSNLLNGLSNKTKPRGLQMSGNVWVKLNFPLHQNISLFEFVQGEKVETNVT